jgi:ATP-dependent DNA helicase RecQ
MEDEKNIANKYPSPKDIARVYELICNYIKVAVGSGQGQSFDFDINGLATYFNIPANLIYNALRILEADGYFQASESVCMPSRMRIRCSYNELYEWQLQNEGVDALFKVLLRSYGGLFDFYTNIYEYEIARRLQKPERWVKEQLSKLKKIEIIDYIPQNNKPQLYFLENRFSSIHISEDRIAFLRSRYREKLEFMNNYVRNKTECRSLNLVKYFGEKDGQACGICDVCLAKKKNLSPAQKFDLYYPKIQPLIDAGGFKLEQLKLKVKSSETLEYLSILRWLKDNNYLEENTEGIWTWTQKKH